jgi:hypothetical protein
VYVRTHKVVAPCITALHCSYVAASARWRCSAGSHTLHQLLRADSCCCCVLPGCRRLISYIYPARNQELLDKLAAKKTTVIGETHMHLLIERTGA